MHPKIDINIKLLTEGATLPKYATDGASGADIYADLTSDMCECDNCGEDCVKTVTIVPGGSRLIKTGWAVALPEGYELQVRPRSGIALKNMITVLNSPGSVDKDYRGEVGVILINHSTETFTVNHKDRIAQLVIAPVVQAFWREQDELRDTVRSKGGFGSTGI